MPQKSVNRSIFKEKPTFRVLVSCLAYVSCLLLQPMIGKAADPLTVIAVAGGEAHLPDLPVEDALVEDGEGDGTPHPVYSPGSFYHRAQCSQNKT